MTALGAEDSKQSIRFICEKEKNIASPLCQAASEGRSSFQGAYLIWEYVQETSTIRLQHSSTIITQARLH